MKGAKDKLKSTVHELESEVYIPGRAYHLIKPDIKESIMATLLNKIEGLEGEPSVKLYFYIDGNFVYKSRTQPKSSNPIISTELDM